MANWEPKLKDGYGILIRSSGKFVATGLTREEALDLIEQYLQSSSYSASEMEAYEIRKSSIYSGEGKYGEYQLNPDGV